MILEVRHLRVVRAIVREGSVTKAAETLHLTQPAVSHTLKDMETRLGVQLFRRKNKRMEPTPEGLSLQRTAERVLNELECAEESLQKFKAGKRGVLRVATQCYTCYHWLPRILKRFQETVPDVDLQIVPEATKETTAALLGERVDLAIVHRDPAHTEIAAVPLFDDEMVAILPPGHRLTKKEWVEPGDFADEHLLLHVPPEESLIMSRYLIPAGVRPRRISQLSLTQAIFETVRAGLGVTAVAGWMVRAEVEAGNLCTRRLAPDGFKRSWYAATLRKSEGLESVSELIRLLQKESAVTVDRCSLACAN